jgi:TetR/AcrR family transcriptional regulator, transcriptional repressor for nem operon
MSRLIEKEASLVGVRQFDDDAVLNKALDLFWRRGIVATSMVDLATATGVQRGSLYNAYGDKQAMFLLAFERYAGHFLDAARTALAHPDPRAALAGFLDVAIANMTKGSPARGCLTTRTAIEADDLGLDVTARLRRLLDELAALIADALGASAPRRALAIDPKAAANVIVTFTRGLAVMERVYRDRRRLKDAAASLVDLLFSQRAISRRR